MIMFLLGVATGATGLFVLTVAGILLAFQATKRNPQLVMRMMMRHGMRKTGVTTQPFKMPR